MPQRTRRNVQWSQRRRSLRGLINVRRLAGGIELQVGTKRLANRNGQRIPVHTTNPKVQRVVRIQSTFTNASPTYSITPSVLRIQDATDYTGTSTARYAFVRVLSARLYVDSPAASLTVPAYGAALVDSANGVQFTDRPVGGSTLATVGMMYCLQTRQSQFPTTSVTLIGTATTDGIVAVGNTISFTLDVLVEFQ